MHKPLHPHTVTAPQTSRSFRRLTTASLLRCATFVAAFAMLCSLSVGCSDGSSMTHIEGTAQFDQQVVQAKGPVLVDFYKNGCPTCVVQDGVLDELAREYKPKVTFLKFKIREAHFGSSNQEIMDRYQLMWVPTVILFIDGKEKQRWTFNHGAAEFRPALDEAIGKKAVTLKKVAPVSAKGGSVTLSETGACLPGQGCPVNRAPKAVVFR